MTSQDNNNHLTSSQCFSPYNIKTEDSRADNVDRNRGNGYIKADGHSMSYKWRYKHLLDLYHKCTVG